MTALSAIILVAAASLNAQEWVEFEGTDELGGVLRLKGILTVPSGKGPFPAAVMVGPCGGFNDSRDAKQQASWARRLASWGYIALQVDSFGPRGFNNICQDLMAVRFATRASDAFAAKDYLSGLPFVDASRIGVLGWSHGAVAVLSIIDAVYRDREVKAFKAAIAFYPFCDGSIKRDTPLLILIGAKDDWCPSRLCERRTDGRLDGGDYELQLAVYPNAYHGFDYEELPVDLYGHHTEYDPEASADAIIRTRDFLAKYLKAAE